MSLCAVWVRSDAGRWWYFPSVRGADWFVCWDDDDPPELVVAAETRADAEEVGRRALGAIREAGGKVKPLGKFGSPSGRCFGGEPEFRPAYRCWLRFDSVPDALLESDREPVRGAEPPHGGVFYP